MYRLRDPESVKFHSECRLRAAFPFLPETNFGIKTTNFDVFPHSLNRCIIYIKLISESWERSMNIRQTPDAAGIDEVWMRSNSSLENMD